MADLLLAVPKCKFCGCTEQAACLVAEFPDGDITPCRWIIFGGRTFVDELMGQQIVDPLDNVCSNPECVARAYREAVGAVAADEMVAGCR